jgi:hypothetical protein
MTEVTEIQGRDCRDLFELHRSTRYYQYIIKERCSSQQSQSKRKVDEICHADATCDAMTVCRSDMRDRLAH